MRLKVKYYAPAYFRSFSYRKTRKTGSTGGGKFDRVMVNFTSSVFPVFYFYKYCAVRLQAIISRVARRVVYKIILLMIELVDRTNKKKVWIGVFSSLSKRY